jgi:hypothetical protein
MKRILLLGMFCTLMLQTAAYAQQLEPVKLIGRHAITFEGGTKTNSNTSVNTSFSGVDVSSGFIGSLNYGYWFDEEWALSLSIGGFGMGAKTTYNNVETSTITPILFGVKFYPRPLALGAVGRIYFGLAAGDYMGFATKTQGILNTSVISESVMGGQISAGLDLFVASWFKLGPKLSYHLMGDFSEVIGSKKNLSGAAFSIEFGFVL